MNSKQILNLLTEKQLANFYSYSIKGKRSPENIVNLVERWTKKKLTIQERNRVMDTIDTIHTCAA